MRLFPCRGDCSIRNTEPWYCFGMTGLETAGAFASVGTACVATVTLGVLIWYTIETHKLRLEAQRRAGRLKRKLAARRKRHARNTFATRLELCIG